MADGGPLGALADALSPGLQAWAQRGQDERVARAWLNSFGNGSPPPPQGGADAVAQLAALRKAQQPAPGPAGPPQAQPPVNPGHPMGPPPQAQPPAPPPGAPTGAPGAEAPTGASVDPRFPDPIKESQSILQNLVMSTKQMNPKADPLTIMKAVEQRISEIKGISPLTKSAAQVQLTAVRQQQDWQYKQARLAQIDQDVEIKVQNAKTAEDRVAAYREGNNLRAQVMREAIGERLEATRETNETHVETTGMNVKGRLDVAKLGNASRMSIAQLKEAGLDDRSAAAIKGKNGAAIVSALSRVKASGMGGDDQKTLDILIAAMGQGGGSSPAPAPKRSGGDSPSVPAGARKAPDGHWYVKKGGSYYRVQ